MEKKSEMEKVLIIEDVEGARNSIRRTLERNGYEVCWACDGKKGLEMIERHVPDLVITDIFMPEMDGLETIQHIVKSKPDLPVIAITGYIETPFLTMALQFGAVFGLYKPFEKEDLLLAVRKALSLRETDKNDQ
jgi:CheY-like chemotaxis protein